MNESVIISNVFHHVAWGTTIAIYFWLVGASAGLFFISSLGWVFRLERYKPLGLPASVTAIILLLLVSILLIFDLGKPLRFVYLLLPNYWNATGPMSWGSILVLCSLIAMISYAYFIAKNNELWARIVGIVALLLVISTDWYTGVVMELNPGQDLNHTALAPLLFLTGAFISGVGLLVLIIWLQNMIVSATKRIEWSLVQGMTQIMMYGLVFNAFLLFLEYMQSIYGRRNVMMGHEAVLLGVFQGPYLWLEIVTGLVIPFFILVSPLKRTRFWVIAASFMVVIGVYGMRIWWVLGGQYLQTFY